MNVFELFAKITLDTSGYEKGLKDSESKMKKAGSAIGNGLKTAAKAGAAAIGVATTAITAFSVASVKTGAKFDKSMSNVKAISGATEEEFDKLREKAIEMGAKTQFSATEAGDAMGYMAMAGWKTADMLDGIEGIMNLAAASGEDLATTSDIVTDALTAFGLSAKDSTHFADILAVASSNANTNVGMMGETFKYVAPVAGALGVSAEDTAEAIGLMANAGIKASQAGTSFRSILTRLSTDAGATSKQYGALGTLTKELGVAFYDNKGKVRDFSDIIDEARVSWQKLSAEDASRFAKKIAGQEGISAWLALMNASTSDVEKLQNAIEKADGAAEDMAKTMVDNLAGDITLFKSALESAQITISDELTPSLREFVKFGTEGVSKLTKEFKNGGISEAFGVLGDLLSDAVDMIVEKLPMVVNAGEKLLVSFAKGIFDSAPKLLTVATQVVQSLISGIMEKLPELLDTSIRILDMIVNGITSNIGSLATSAVLIISQLAQMLIERIPDLVKVALELIKGLADGLLKALPELVKQIPVIINGLVNALLESIPMIIDAGVELLTSLADDLPTIINTIVEVIPVIVTNLTESIIKNAPKLAVAGFKLFVAIVKNMPKIIFQINGAGIDIVATLVASLYKQIPKMAIAGLKLLKSLWDNLPEIIRKGREKVSELFQAMKEKFESLSLVEVGKNLIKGLWDGIKSMKDWLFDMIGDFGSGLVKKVKGIFKIKSPSRVFAEIGKFLALGLGEGWEDAFPDVQNGIEDDLAFDVGQAVSDIEASVRTTGTDGEPYTLSDVYSMMSRILESIETSGMNTVSAIENTDTSIVLNDREFGRAVRKAYA